MTYLKARDERGIQLTSIPFTILQILRHYFDKLPDSFSLAHTHIPFTESSFFVYVCRSTGRRKQFQILCVTHLVRPIFFHQLDFSVKVQTISMSVTYPDPCFVVSATRRTTMRMKKRENKLLARLGLIVRWRE